MTGIFVIGFINFVLKPSIRGWGLHQLLLNKQPYAKNNSVASILDAFFVTQFIQNQNLH
jgi:hypothetical protein